MKACRLKGRGVANAHRQSVGLPWAGAGGYAPGMDSNDLAALAAAARDTRFDLHDEAGLRAVYPNRPQPPSLVKVVDHIHPLYRPFIEAAPFVVLCTSGPRGLDASPRGDVPGFVRIVDEHTLLLPDRRGNNRLDSLGNLLTDPRLALMFLVPGCNEALRVNGRGRISTSAVLCEALAMQGKPPASVIVVEVASVYFQCARALLRSRLWEPDARIDRATLPSIGTILGELSQQAIDGAAYDAELPARQRSTLY